VLSALVFSGKIEVCQCPRLYKTEDNIARQHVGPCEWNNNNPFGIVLCLRQCYISSYVVM
jgi:hypothetical protein